VRGNLIEEAGHALFSVDFDHPDGRAGGLVRRY
jgi:hypothetical protein